MAVQSSPRMALAAKLPRLRAVARCEQVGGAQDQQGGGDVAEFEGGTPRADLERFFFPR